MTGALSPTHWLLVILVVALLFGAQRLPAAARGLGQSMRIFKAETSALAEERAEEKRTTAVSSAPTSDLTSAPANALANAPATAAPARPAGESAA